MEPRSLKVKKNFRKIKTLVAERVGEINIDEILVLQSIQVLEETIASLSHLNLT